MREDLMLQRRFLAAVREWEDNGRDAGYLLSGPRLIQLGAWVDGTELSLTETERSYLAQSRTYEVMRRRSARNRKVGLVVGIAAAVLSVAGIGSLALNDRNRANEQGVVALEQTELAEDFEAAAARERATVEELEQQIETDGGTIDTPIGTFTWEHITGDETNIPGSFQAIATPQGFAMIDSRWQWDGTTNTGAWMPAQYWTSADGKKWNTAAFPIPLEAESYQTQKLGGAYWVTTTNPASLWRSDEGQTWREVPLPAEIGVDDFLFLQEVDSVLWLGNSIRFSARTSRDVQGMWRSIDGSPWQTIDTTSLQPPEITGIVSTQVFWEPPVNVGDLTMLKWDRSLTINFYDVLGVSQEEYQNLEGFWDPATETMALRNGRDTTLASLTVEAEGNRRVLRESGEVVHEIVIPDESAASLLEGWNFDGYFRLPTTLVLIDADGTVTSVTPPWAIPESTQPFSYGFQEETKLLVTNDQFLAYVTLYDGGVTGELWTSHDGITWSGPTKPGFLPDDGKVEGFWIENGGGLIRAHVSTAGGQEMWMTEDGLNWDPADFKSPTGVALDLDSGYAFYSDTVVKEMFVSTDLKTWDAVDTSPLGIQSSPNGSGSFGGFSAGDTIFFVLNEAELGFREMWVLQLEN